MSWHELLLELKLIVTTTIFIIKALDYSLLKDSSAQLWLGSSCSDVEMSVIKVGCKQLFFFNPRSTVRHFVAELAVSKKPSI